MTARAYTTRSRMNKTESDYAMHLEILRAAGQVKRWDFEPAKLRLADKTWYTPDFRVVMSDDTIEFHEVKGFWRDDARVKIKIAAEHHPYRFVAVKRNGAGWQYEQISKGDDQ